MILIQIVIAVLIPAAMIVCGRRLGKNIPEYDSRGFAFKTRAAKLSEEAWIYGNKLFANMLFTTGINVIIVAALFMMVAVLAADANGWMLACVMAVIEAVSVLLPVIVTNRMILMNYDENGKLRKEMKRKKKENRWHDYM